MEIERIKKIIHKENELLRIADKEQDRIKEILKPYLNQVVLKQDYTFLKKIKDLISFDREQEIKPFKMGDNAKIGSIYLGCSEYHIYLNIFLCFDGGSYENKNYYCEYHENTFYIGKIENRVLIEFHDYKKGFINEEEQINQYKKVIQLKEEFNKEKDKLNYRLRENI